MEIIGNYAITKSSSSHRQDASLKVKSRLTGEILVMMKSSSMSDLLGHIRKYPGTDERTEFVRQLTKHDVSLEDIDMLLRAAPAKRIQNANRVEMLKRKLERVREELDIAMSEALQDGT